VTTSVTVGLVNDTRVIRPTEMLTLKVSPSLKAEITALARAQGTSRSELLRRLASQAVTEARAA
jgi:hypothetical protein